MLDVSGKTNLVDFNKFCCGKSQLLCCCYIKVWCFGATKLTLPDEEMQLENRLLGNDNSISMFRSQNANYSNT